MTGCLHPENGYVQTAILDPFTEEWLLSVDEQCPLNCIDWKPRIEKGKQPDAVFQDYYTHYFYYNAHYFSWLSRSRIAVAVSTSYALQIYVNWFWVLQQAYGASRKLPLPSEAPKMFRFCVIILHYIAINAMIFSIIRIIPKQKVASWVGILCR